MSEEKTTTQFLAYLDDNDEIINGYFEITDSKHPAYIEFLSKGNIVRIPWHRVLKNKEKEECNGN